MHGIVNVYREDTPVFIQRSLILCETVTVTTDVPQLCHLIDGNLMPSERYVRETPGPV